MAKKEEQKKMKVKEILSIIEGSQIPEEVQKWLDKAVEAQMATKDDKLKATWAKVEESAMQKLDELKKATKSKPAPKKGGRGKVAKRDEEKAKKPDKKKEEKKAEEVFVPKYEVGTVLNVEEKSGGKGTHFRIVSISDIEMALLDETPDGKYKGYHVLVKLPKEGSVNLVGHHSCNFKATVIG